MMVSRLFKVFLAGVLLVQFGCSTHTKQPPAPPEPPPAQSPAQPNENSAPEPAPEDTHEAKLPEPPHWPESALAVPEPEVVSAAVKYDTVLMSRTLGTPQKQGWHYRLDQRGRVVGFEFSNHGGNAIVPEQYDLNKNRLFTRDFQFHFDNRARQDIHIFVSDWVPSRDKQSHLSEIMNSVLMVFPRSYLPAITDSGDRYLVTLATGERVAFDAATREIRGGVFSEGPVDLNPDKNLRRYPQINYTGRGVLIRANARGSDPRIGTTATITTGTPAADCNRAGGCDRCTVPAKELWQQSGSVAFKFPTDAEFDRFLLERCGFGLPRNGADFALAGADAAASLR